MFYERQVQFDDKGGTSDMAKIKVSIKDSQIIVKSKLDKTEAVNEREIEVFQKKLIRGFMRPAVESERKVSYLAPMGLPLHKYLQKGLTKNDFFLVFMQIVEVVRKIEKNSFNINNLILNMKYVFVNEFTKELYFIYQPITTQATPTNLFSFIYDVIQRTNLKLDEGDNFLNELISFLRGMQAFSTEQIEQYITKVYPEVYKQIHRERDGQSNVLQNKQQPEANAGVNAGVGSEETTVLVDYTDDDEDGTGLLADYDDGSNETTALVADEDPETGLLVEEVKVRPYIVRIQDSEKVEVNKPVFRIGKEKSYVDYFVTNNSAVSRLHADIITKENNRFFISDNNSTNGTFINGRLIPEKTETEIFDGDELKLANERFEFHTV